MAIDPIPEFPEPPTRDQTQDDFTNTTIAFFDAFPEFREALNTYAGQANDLAAAMTAAAAGGAFAIGYTFSTTTADADPGAGRLRLGNATQNAAAVIRASETDAAGSDWASALDLFDDSTSSIKGFIRLGKVADGTRWLLFAVTAVSDAGAYRNITATCVASSHTNPFSNNDALELEFGRNGDKGDQGLQGAPGATFTGGPVADPITLQNAVSFTGFFTPAQITANQNNYAPADVGGVGMDDVFGLRLSSDASRDITGIAAPTSGRLLLALNVGAQPIVFKHESGSSTAANRIIGAAGADTTLLANEAALLLYDPTSSRWRMLLKASAALGTLLTNIAAMTLNDNQMIVGTGSSGVEGVTIADFARTFIDDTSASAVFTTLGISAFVQTLLDDASAATFQTTLGISAFVQTLLDDTSASNFLTTLGYTTFVKTLLGAADAAAFKALIGVPNVTVSSSAPSGGSNGDLWFQTGV